MTIIILQKKLYQGDLNYIETFFNKDGCDNHRYLSIKMYYGPFFSTESWLSHVTYRKICEYHSHLY